MHTGILALSGAVLFTGAYLSLAINRKYFKPALGVLNKLKSTAKKREERTGGNLFSEISGYIDGILKEKTELEEKLRGNNTPPAAGSGKEKSAGFLGDPAEQLFGDKWYPVQGWISNVELIQKVIDYIEEHFMDKVGLDMIAKQLLRTGILPNYEHMTIFLFSY